MLAKRGQKGKSRTACAHSRQGEGPNAKRPTAVVSRKAYAPDRGPRTGPRRVNSVAHPRPRR